MLLQINETSFMSLNKKMLTILLKLCQKVSYERQKQQSNNVVSYLQIVPYEVLA